MSYEEEATSWALSLFDALESYTHTTMRVFIAAGGALVTLVIWIFHLINPEVFTYFLHIDSWAKLILGSLLAPPFVAAFTIGSFIYPQPVEPKTEDRSGPMSTYFYRERASRRWKLLIAAGICAALNFVLMLITSGI